MSGELNLSKLLKELNPQLNDGEFVFVTVKEEVVDDIDCSDVLSAFRENEGTTLVMRRAVADRLGFPYDYPFSWITLKVHSSLDAVGLTAAFSIKLAEHNISCNVIAGYHHDHLFVDTKNAQTAIRVLRKLSEDNQ